DQFMEALTERLRSGVQVRVLLDAFGALRAPDDDFDRLVKAGARIAKFRPAVFGKLLRFHRRNHRRAVVIDGRVAFTGGAAIADKWAGSASSPREWRDTMVRVDGCLAQNLQSAFCELWAFCTGEVLTGEDVFPPDLRDERDSGVHSCGVISSPSSEEHPLRLFFFLTFLAARERLWITTPYFVPDKHTREVVKRRARAGVDVRILMPNHHTDARPIRQASHSYYSELLNAGVRIYEYQPTMMHTKGVVVDGKWSVVGSANMDIRSKELNEENVLGVLDSRFARELEHTFLADIEHAREINRVQWGRRGLGNRIIERICVLFAEQY
ncbi:MAG: phospholipase D-like domain-containing protein, partial [Longimicrobiales bacterium]